MPIKRPVMGGGGWVKDYLRRKFGIFLITPILPLSQMEEFDKLTFCHLNWENSIIDDEKLFLIYYSCLRWQHRKVKS